MTDYYIGPKSLRFVAPNLTLHDATQVADSLGDAMERFHIVTRRRAAAFVAQLAHESAGFQFRREIWGPTSWQFNYAHMLGNNGMSDAYAYRGGGWIQLTGKSNYRSAGEALGIPLVEKPWLMNELKYCSLVSAWWWNEHSLNHLADRLEFKAITRTINGGFNGLASRYAYWSKARVVGKYLVPRTKKVKH